MVTTYHGMGAGLVARHLLELDLHPRTRLLNRAEAWQLLFLVFDEFRFDKKRVFRPGIVVNDALTLASHCADHLVDIADVAADARTMATDARWKASRETAEGRFELCQIVAAYEREKRRRHLMDFDDQIRLAVVLLRDRPELARRLSGQRPFVLLDEYQDTNFAQRILLQTIYPPGSAITAVGDDMQSIYAFRGAHLRNLLDFGVHFPPAAELALTVNRRSGPAVVDLANRIQAQVKESVPKQLTARAGGADRGGRVLPGVGRSGGSGDHRRRCRGDWAAVVGARCSLPQAPSHPGHRGGAGGRRRARRGGGFVGVARPP